MEKWSCSNCGDNFLPHQGKIFKDSEYHASFVCDVCGDLRQVG